MASGGARPKEKGIRAKKGGVINLKIRSAQHPGAALKELNITADDGGTINVDYEEIQTERQNEHSKLTDTDETDPKNCLDQLSNTDSDDDMHGEKIRKSNSDNESIGNTFSPKLDLFQSKGLDKIVNSNINPMHWHGADEYKQTEHEERQSNIAVGEGNSKPRDHEGNDGISRGDKRQAESHPVPNTGDKDLDSDGRCVDVAQLSQSVPWQEVFVKHSEGLLSTPGIKIAPGCIPLDCYGEEGHSFGGDLETKGHIHTRRDENNIVPGDGLKVESKDESTVPPEDESTVSPEDESTVPPEDEFTGKDKFEIKSKEKSEVKSDSESSSDSYPLSPQPSPESSLTPGDGSNEERNEEGKIQPGQVGDDLQLNEENKMNMDSDGYGSGQHGE